MEAIAVLVMHTIFKRVRRANAPIQKKNEGTLHRSSLAAAPGIFTWGGGAEPPESNETRKHKPWFQERSAMFIPKI